MSPFDKLRANGGEYMMSITELMIEKHNVDRALVGKTKLRLDERRRSRKEEQKVLTTLDQKIAAVRTEYPKEKIVPLLVTHYARQAFAQKIRDQGIILVQSCEW
jgi:hypothetical protein